MKKSHLFLFLCLINLSVNAADPYQDPNLQPTERARDLVSRMTLVEKISQLGSKSSAISRLNVKAYNYWVEGLHGVARQGLATSFPQPLGMAATWDTTLIYSVATVISDEARVKNNTVGLGLTYWCPVVNMDRDPRWGREEENFGEDIFLASRLAVNYIKGMQGNNQRYLKTVATAKHFACNNVEQGRTSTSSNPDERSFREYFLPVFKACVQEGGVSSIMSAYNAVNSVPSPANRTILENILRKEWGFNGFVVSDCDAVSDIAINHKWAPSLSQATAISIKAGTDLNCGSTYQNYAADAVNKGILNESEIDTALVRVFTMRIRLGEFDSATNIPYTSIPQTNLDCQANRDLAYHTAQKAIVLLKNKNSFLPLNKNNVQSLAVIGPNGKAVMLGDYSGSPSVSITPFQGLAAKLGISVFDGTIEAESATILSGGPKSEACGEGGSEIGYIKNNTYVGYDSISFDSNMDKVDLRVASNNTTGGTLQILLDNPANGIVVGTASIPYTGGWQVWSTISANVTNLSGRHKLYLKFTGGSGYLYNLNWLRFYNSTQGSAVPSKFTASGKSIYYSFGTSVNGTSVQAQIDSAVNVAKRVQYVVMVCGTDDNTGGESSDRSGIGLPGAQSQLIQAVYAANPNTVLVLVNGFSLAVNWEDTNLPAIMTAWYAGQAQGAAIADVIFGDYNPAGRLPSTWYKGLTDLPTKYDYNIRHNRTYMYYKGTPLYPFGHGLSYSSFEYSNMKVSSSTINMGEFVEVSVDVKNTSTVYGEEVPQLYINIPSIIDRPVKQLKGFSRISLNAGETKTVRFRLKYEDLQYYDTDTRTYRVESGPVNLYMGTSSQDIRQTMSINAAAGNVNASYRRNPYAEIQAEAFEAKSVSALLRNTPEGVCVDSLLNNGYLAFKNLNFENGALRFRMRYATSQSSGSVTIAQDSISGKVLGTLNLSNTGSTDIFTTDSCNLLSVKDVHDIYLVFKGSGQIARVKSVTFTRNLINSADIVSDTKKGYISVFPNPAKRDLSITFSQPLTAEAEIVIYNMLGENVFTKKVNSGIGEFKIDLHTKNIWPGAYILKVRSENISKSFKINIIN